ncbi:MAG: FecR domain-containing protein [Tenuifilaceae bacterium]|nr:FecR domain-containing protein [Tenuifilaceae bacterium]
MELNLNITEHRNSLAKYVAGEMTLSETEEFETLVDTNPNNKKLVNDTKNDWNIIGANHIKLPNANKAWNNLKTRIELETPLAQATNFKRKGKVNFVRWAVAAMAVIVIASAYFTVSTIRQNIVVNSTSALTTLVHTLPDGSSVFLEANSQISYTKRFAKKNRNITLKGQAFFDIAKNPEIPFNIETLNTSIKVLGTSFSVKSTNSNDFELVVQTGSVNITQKNNRTESITATPGDRVTLENNHLTKYKENATPLKTLLNKRLQFKDESLANIIQAINKTYNTNIVLGSSAIGSRKLTVTFMNNSVQSMVEVICKTLHLNAEYKESSITLWKP